MKMNFNEHHLSLSVTELTRLFFTNETSRSEENSESGKEIHSLIQKELKEKDPSVVCEEKITYTYKKKGAAGELSVEINGIIDAYSGEKKTLYEIKTFLFSPEDDFSLYNFEGYEFQLSCYDHMMEKNSKKKADKLFLYFVTPNSKNRKLVEIKRDPAEFPKQWNKVISILYDQFYFNKLIMERSYFFPYPEKNNHQEGIVGFIKNSDVKTLFVEAPFGVGKTSAVLYSVLSKWSCKNIQLLFLTSRNTQKNNIEKEFKHFSITPFIMNSVEDVCRLGYKLCKFEKCPHFIENKNRLFKKLGKNLLKFFLDAYPEIMNRGIPGKNIKSCAEKPEYTDNTIEPDNQEFWTQVLKLDKNFCYYNVYFYFYIFYPFIIADYNTLIFRKSKGIAENKICVIDEFQSFARRIKNSFTIELTLGELDKYLKIVNRFLPELSPLTENFIRSYNDFSGDGEDTYFESLHFSDFTELLYTVMLKTYEKFKENADPDFNDCFFRTIYPFAQKLEFLSILLNYKYRVAVFKNEKKKLYLITHFHDLMNDLLQVFDKVIGMSATLNPEKMIQEMFPDSRYEMYSLTEKKRISVYLYTEVRTIARERKKYILKITDFIKSEVKSHQLKTILCFVPSYDFAKSCEIFFFEQVYKKIFPRGGTFMKNLEEQLGYDQINIIFFPYYSIASEGLNIPLKIDAVFCIGMAYPRMDDRFKTREYLLKEEEENPYLLLSLFPAINEVLQASGRIDREYFHRRKVQGGEKDDQSGTEKKHYLFFLGEEFLQEKVLSYLEKYYEDIKIIKE